MLIYFFFQAEDGIRDWSVTGVQTCALPIFPRSARKPRSHSAAGGSGPPTGSRGNSETSSTRNLRSRPSSLKRRSEERRVGKECRSRWATDHEKKKRRV